MAAGQNIVTRFLLTALMLLSWTFVLGAHEPKSPLGPAVRREVRLPVRDFSLTDQNGQRFDFARYRGKIVIVNFIYTSCPDVCPLLTANLKLLQSALSDDELGRVHLVSITTDPEIDKPQALKAYAERYGVGLTNWSFLSGTPEELGPVWRSFGVAVIKQGRGLVDHTTLTGMIDAQGIMRFAYYGMSPDPGVMLRDLKSME